MINDLKKLRELSEEFMISRISINMWEQVEYRFGNNLDIKEAVKNYSYLDNATKRVIEFIAALNMIAFNDEPLIDEITNNTEVLAEIVRLVRILKLTSGYSKFLNNFLDNWGENQGLEYRGIDLSIGLNSRVAMNLAGILNGELQNEIEKKSYID